MRGSFELALLLGWLARLMARALLAYAIFICRFICFRYWMLDILFGLGLTGVITPDGPIVGMIGVRSSRVRRPLVLWYGPRSRIWVMSSIETWWLAKLPISKSPKSAPMSSLNSPSTTPFPRRKKRLMPSWDVISPFRESPAFTTGAPYSSNWLRIFPVRVSAIAASMLVW